MNNTPPPTPGSDETPPLPGSGSYAPPETPFQESPPVESPIEPIEITQSQTETAALLAQIKEQISKVFIGQHEVVDSILAAMLAGGHVLLEGKPGLGKTHLIVALSKAFGGEFRRIQFTPDLMPSDVTGHMLFDMGSQTFRVRRGPVFTNLLLADEINRAPAKTQAALLEVMQETQVTFDGETHVLEPPFMTFATQNPIEQEGTYPLPEAQLDRFLMKVLIGYPQPGVEEKIVREATRGVDGGGLSLDQIESVCSPEDIIQAQVETAGVQAVDEVVKYAVGITRATREAQGISLGAGTRGAISLVLVAKSYAIMAGRGFITPDDVKSAVLPVFRHRVALAPELAISGAQVDDTLLSIVATVEAPRS